MISPAICASWRDIEGYNTFFRVVRHILHCIFVAVYGVLATVTLYGRFSYFSEYILMFYETDLVYLCEGSTWYEGNSVHRVLGVCWEFYGI